MVSIIAIKDAQLDCTRQVHSYSEYLVAYDNGTEAWVPAHTVPVALELKYLKEHPLSDATMDIAPGKTMQRKNSVVANNIKAFDNNSNAADNSARGWDKPTVPASDRRSTAVPVAKVQKTSAYSTANTRQSTRPPAPEQQASRRDSAIGQSSDAIRVAARRISSTTQVSRRNALTPQRTPECDKITAPGHDEYELPPPPPPGAPIVHIPGLRKNDKIIIVKERPSEKNNIRRDHRGRNTIQYLIYLGRDNQTGKKSPLVWVSDKAVHQTPKAEWAASGRQQLFSVKQVLERRKAVEDAQHLATYGY
ncbi:uncharacterized protein BDZ99DRAFT_567308 [Mytilinidion resinicola]|uniref:Uncharacterized protein n=1 Tax=Mytilinidion resinicola TaxID=574789 RepID=A0A6A6Z5J6_9PEZI|nr:uncharacterized protein BDZ99DRAFT_567308 [Mytilinidion resinicola]KAF2815475.1 hypothetical protein BDZ99DRAFT_567308 [Mytilinidion resinicola]